MFEGLKKKFTSFVSGLSKKEEEKVEEAVKAEPKAQEIAKEPVPTPRPMERKPEPAPKKMSEPVPTVTQRIEPQEAPKIMPKPVQQPQKEREEHKPQPKVTTTTKIKSIFMREVTVKDDDIEPFMEELKIELLQSDVNYEAAEKILDGIRANLVGKPINSKNISMQITDALTSAVLSILKKKNAIDVVAVARQKKQSNELPFKILFIGPNGAGKTTTMAKMAHLFLKNGFTCVLSASDTFRAAAIEQTTIHAGRLGIGVIKGNYGADPASIAFDAIAHAKAQKIDIVLIDSAGRQETNKSLMEEVKKMVRIAKPDLKIFVGESISGNTLLNQVKEFNAAVGLDGVILTKMDCDAKGGNTLSIISEADVPILYFGLGEGYGDLMPYDPDFIIRSMIQNN